MLARLWWALAGVIILRCARSLCASTTVTLKATTTTLSITRTWPADLAGGEAILAGSQVLQVLFSRAVLAPNATSSTSATSCAAKVPFTLWCATSSVPAALSCQWLNASMVRWAPLHAWPPDLDCTLRINAALTAYDGAKLAPGQAWSAPLRTKPLAWQVGLVTSGALRWHLGGDARVWQGAGRVAEVGYEVPPDGLVTLNLSHPVSVAALSKGLRVVEPPGSRHSITFYGCRQPWEMGSRPPRLTARSPDTSCVALHFSPPLAKFTRYYLALPQGTRYSQPAGALSRTLTANVSGLHGFVIPFLPGERSPAQPRSLARVRLWLPRGLAPNVTAARLAALVAVRRDTPFADSACPDTTVKVLSSRLLHGPPTSRAPTHLELQLGRVCPGRTYRVTVKAAADVRDVLGMPLEASEGTATSAEPPGKPAPLLPINRPVVHMLHGDVPEAWPLVVPL